MVIRIRRTPEPLSEQSSKPGDEGLVYTAQSSASRILKQEMRRYCDGHIQGRSFLIAGHRGAGKTTMVSDVLTSVIKLSQTGEVSLRLLPVMLHGPSLFRAMPSDVRTAAAQHAVESGSTTPAPAVAPPLTQTLDEDSRVELQAQLALKQIILGLHRAVLAEYAAAYRREMVPEHAATSAGAGRSEAGELAAQFELELMEDPPASRLRELWEHVGALDRGILFPKGRVADQGARELVALNGICNAHQRISGELSGETQLKSQAARVAEQVTGIDPKATEALKPIAAVLSGAAVAGGSVVSQAVSLPGALLAGLITAVAASLILKRTSTVTGKRERQVDKKFIPDLSLRTLDRVLPTLLERLRSAGLAPVFVIDELDKVDGLSDRIMAMVHYLKKLVAESVFTCFLTDRGYMEFLRLAAREKAYGLAYSYFSHPLLIAHEPADLDAYLNDVLELPRAGTGATASPADSTDEEILKWVLRHRSQMHALNLTRELAAMRTEAGNSNILPGTVRDAAFYRIDATLQVAIEFFLNSTAVVGWAIQRANMRQTLFDALYFISREWLSGTETLDLRAEKKDAFRTSLYNRMNLNEVFLCKDGENTAQVPDGAEKSLVSDDDLKLLYGTVCEMARFLSGKVSAARIQATWPRNRHERDGMPKSPKPEQSVLEVLMLGAKSVLKPDPSVPDLYTFRYWQSGERRDIVITTPRDPKEIHEAAVPQLDYVNRLEGSLALLMRPQSSVPASAMIGADFRLLTDEARVLPQTPPWQTALAARDMLTQAKERAGNAAELEEHLLTLSEFFQMLRDNIHAVGPALLNAAFLAGVVPSSTLEPGLPQALKMLSGGLRFSQLSSDVVVTAVTGFQQYIDAKLNEKKLPSAPGIASDGELQPDAKEHVIGAFAKGQEFGATQDWVACAALAWQQLLVRLAAHERGNRTAPSGFDEILCAARGAGPSRLLRPSVFESSLRAWSTALCEGMRPRGPDTAQDDAPFGIVGHALLRLGFGRFDSAWVESFCQTVPALARASGEDGASLRSTLIESEAWKREAKPIGAVVVVCKPNDSITGAWTEMPTKALFIVLTQQQFRSEASRETSILSMLPAPVHLLWEGVDGKTSPDADTVADATKLRQTFFMPPLDLLTPPWSRSSALLTPRGADELVSLLRAS